jgi:hypothetical protein
MLQNPAYAGRAAFGRTRSVPLQARCRAARGRPAQSRRGYSPRATPEQEWISIPVPALVDEALFAAAQEQLRENRRRARIPLKGSRYLLQGLIVCARCGYAYYGRTNDARNAYYRCSASDAYRWGGTRLCANREVRMDRVDQAVWAEVVQVLHEPERVAQEYRQRLQPAPPAEEARGVETQLAKLQRGRARLLDAYTEGLVEKAEFDTRMTQVRGRIQQLEQQARQLRDLEQEDQELRLLAGSLDRFAAQVREGLAAADWATRREIIRALVKRVEIDQEQVRVVFRISPTTPRAPASDPSPSLQHHEPSVHPGRLHGHHRAAPLPQPVQQRQQGLRRGPETALLRHHRPRRLRAQHTGLHLPLVHVQAAAAGMHHVHGFLVASHGPSSPHSMGGRAAWPTRRESYMRAPRLGATDRDACGHAGQTAVRAQGTTVARPPCTRLTHLYHTASPPPFHPPGWRRQGGAIEDCGQTLCSSSE